MLESASESFGESFGELLSEASRSASPELARQVCWVSTLRPTFQPFCAQLPVRLADCRCPHDIPHRTTDRRSSKAALTRIIESVCPFMLHILGSVTFLFVLSLLDALY